MAKYACVFRTAGSKTKHSRNVLLDQDEPDGAKVVPLVTAVLADEFRVKPEHVVMLAVEPRGLTNSKPWRRPADAPKPPDNITTDDEYQGPTRKQLSELKKADLIDLILAKKLEIDTDQSADALRAAVMKALNPPR